MLIIHWLSNKMHLNEIYDLKIECFLKINFTTEGYKALFVCVFGRLISRMFNERKRLFVH